MESATRTRPLVIIDGHVAAIVESLSTVNSADSSIEITIEIPSDVFVPKKPVRIHVDDGDRRYTFKEVFISSVSKERNMTETTIEGIAKAMIVRNV
jgi:hypothetical protein